MKHRPITSIRANYYGLNRLFNVIPYGYWGYRIVNFFYEKLNADRFVMPRLVDGKYYCYYFPCGKNEKWWEVSVSDKHAFMRLRDIMNHKWMRQ